ncbi:MAG TPA: RiPP maturation radical SAM C-methyltransferase [Thermoanaerobaculia bacterium]|nr:RiPP maturation radical SAM C-methyltransferase [Thermoanaerobaculia bacterium]
MRSRLDERAPDRHIRGLIRKRPPTRRTEAVDVLLVSMPFGPEMAPSLGLSLLKAGLAPLGVSCRVLYLTLSFAERLGVGPYTRIATDGTRSIRELAGEHVFREALFGRDVEADARWERDVLLARACWPSKELARPVPPSFVGAVRRARSLAGPFLERALDEVLAHRPRLVGFTSVFQQHVASLALARRIRTAAPETVVVIGGANCEGVMGAETARSFPFLDAVVSGEGDLVFPELVARALAGRALDDLPGVATPGNVEAHFAAGRFPNAPSVTRMDDLPVPDDGDYFEQFAQSRFAGTWTPGLFLETARGCSWGQKSHCTFCGLNGTTMAFRSKSPARALAELRDVTSRHPESDLQVVDNILDTRYFESLLPELAKSPPPSPVFWETKASLKKEQVRALAEAGVTRIQPGVESLSDAVLKLMKKGVTALQNVQLLKWCRELGVTPYWNLLWGFPDEEPSEYARMARLVPLLAHLAPPAGVAGLRLDRFSPGFDDADRLGFLDVAPMPSYAAVYPFPPDRLANLAYSFTFARRGAGEAAEYVAPLLRALARWKRVAGASALFSVPAGDALFVFDLRTAARRPLTVLRGEARAVHDACDASTNVRAVVERVRSECGFAREATERALSALVRDRLLLEDGERRLALAVPLGRFAPDGRASARFHRLARRIGRRTRDGIAFPVHNAAVTFRTRNGDDAPHAPRDTRTTSSSSEVLLDRFSVNRRGELVFS